MDCPGLYGVGSARGGEVGLCSEGVFGCGAFGERLADGFNHRFAVVHRECHLVAVNVHQTVVGDFYFHSFLRKGFACDRRHYFCHTQVHWIVDLCYLHVAEVQAPAVGGGDGVEADMEIAGRCIDKEESALTFCWYAFV